jgi:hypothetical protein
MALDRINLLNEDGFPSKEYSVEFENDDDAVDHAGSTGHPHQIEIWEGGRLVASFPPEVNQD